MRYLLLLGLLVGCDDGSYARKEYTDRKEVVTVLSSNYLPEVKGDGARIGITTSGDLGIVSGGRGQEEKYVVTLKSPERGKYVLQSKDLWSKLDAGDTVELTWRSYVISYYDKSGKKTGSRKSHLYPWDADIIQDNAELVKFKIVQ